MGSEPNSPIAEEKRIKRYSGVLTVLWTVVIIAFLVWHIMHEHEDARIIVAAQAKAYFDQDRSEKLIKALHAADIGTAEKHTKQLSKADSFTQLFSKASLRLIDSKPLDADNLPGGWESNALSEIGNGSAAVVLHSKFKGAPVVQMVKPVVYSSQCTGCHVDRDASSSPPGGLSITIPLTAYFTSLHEELATRIAVHILAWLFGILVIRVGTRHVVYSVRVSKLAEKALSEERGYLNSILDSIADGIAVCDDKGILTMFNRASELFHGAPVKSIPPEKWASNYNLYRPDGRQLMRTKEIPLYRALHEGKVTDQEMVIAPNNGPPRIVLASGKALIEKSGKKIGAVVSMHDITERKQSEVKIAYLAFHDSLTGLPNRTLLIDRLDQALMRAKRHKTLGAALFIDLDRFKTINDSLGHLIGDEMLKEIARRLSVCIRGDDTLARLGGDEFMVLLNELGKTESEARRHAERIAKKLRSILSRPISIKGHDLHSTPSIGIAVFSGDLESADDIVRRSDTAMYRAKADGRNTIRIFLPEMQDQAVAQLELENDLRHALDRGELMLYYQPQIDLADGNIIGAEALLRWIHPKKGIISPDKFIPIAEDTGLILPIGEFVLREACFQNKVWQAANLPRIRVAVNLSSAQFLPNLFESVDLLLQDTGLEAQYLELEMTETMIMENAGSIITTLQELKSLGVQISIDDFGTGYSSLSYLTKFAIDKLKIDKSFVEGISKDAGSATITRTIVSMAQNLNLKTIAEGVETREQLEFLAAAGCNEAQGFLLGKPVSAEEFPELFSDPASRRAAG